MCLSICLRCRYVHSVALSLQSKQVVRMLFLKCKQHLSQVGQPLKHTTPSLLKSPIWIKTTPCRVKIFANEFLFMPMCPK